jgi:hypothetical protein
LFAFAGWTWWSRRQERARPPVERLAVLPFENLSGDPGQDWLSGALSEVTVAQLAGMPDLMGFGVRSSGEAAGRYATRLVHGSWQKAGAGFELRLEVESAANHSFQNETRSTVGAAEALLEQAARDAGALRRMSRGKPAAVESVKASGEAWRAYGASTQAADLETALAKAAEATRAEPGFTLAWHRRLELLLASGRASQVVEVAAQAAQSVPAADRPLIAWLGSAGAGDRQGAGRAAVAWAVRHPADADLQVEAARAAHSGRDFAAAARLFANALRLRPQDAEWWNQAAYSQGYAGDWDGARRSLVEYARLAPASPNPGDSLGELMMRAGRWDEAAAAFREVARKAPQFLAGEPMRKAAYARLYAGDLAGARAGMERYFAAHTVPSAGLEKAVWLRISGNRAGSLAALQALGENPAAKLIGSLWSLEEGGSATPRTDFGPEAALLAQRRFAEAAALLRRRLVSIEPAAETSVRELLAWCEVEQENWGEARKLLSAWPIPLPADWLQPFHYLPRTLYLRGVLAAREKRAEQARRHLEMYLQLAAASSDPFQHVAKARGLLSQLK